jgi:flagellar basal-body rod protein FlgC
MDPLLASLKVAASGLEAQSTRIRIVSENLANARSTGDVPGADPFRRKTVTFAAELDRASGASLVEVERLGFDEGEFSTEYDQCRGHRQDAERQHADRNGRHAGSQSFL